MRDLVPVLGVTPVTPHHAALADFVSDVKALYDLSDADEARLLDAVGNFVNIVAVNALAQRPRPQEAKPRVALGVQDGPEFMRCDEVSEALGIAESTLSHMRKRGAGPAFRNNGRTILYRRADVRAWATANGSEPPRDSLGLLQSDNTDPSEVRHGA